MATIKKTELWEELNATDEAFVRRKYAMGGYGPAKQRLVREWIAQQDAMKLDEKAFWTKAAAYAAWAAAFAAIAALFK